MKRVALLLLLAAIAACGDRITNQYTTINEGAVTTVRAKVIGWSCFVGDFVNNTYGPGKFDASESGRAKVTFEYINGLKHSEYTNDSSEVSLSLPHGPYRIIVETEFTWPDTFANFLIPRDTSILLELVYDFFFIDSIHIGFFYDPASDSLGYYEEFRLLRRLASLSNYMIEVYPHTVRRTGETRILFGTPMTFNDYYIPLRNRSELYTYQAIDVVSAVLAAGKADGTIPTVMSLKSIYYLCFD